MVLGQQGKGETSTGNTKRRDETTKKRGRGKNIDAGNPLRAEKNMRGGESAALNKLKGKRGKQAKCVASNNGRPFTKNSHYRGGKSGTKWIGGGGGGGGKTQRIKGSGGIRWKGGQKGKKAPPRKLWGGDIQL